jgi:Na+-driven multidrug efflux pump
VHAQVCFQLWLSSSLMADSLAVACQTLLARSLAVKDTTSARQVCACAYACVDSWCFLGLTTQGVEGRPCDTPHLLLLLLQVVSRCVGMSAVLGGALAVALAAARGSIPGLFTTDPGVLLLVHALLPWVVASQPINALAFVWDGVLFGAGGFRWVV